MQRPEARNVRLLLRKDIRTVAARQLRTKPALCVHNSLVVSAPHLSQFYPLCYIADIVLTTSNETQWG